MLSSMIILSNAVAEVGDRVCQMDDACLGASPHSLDKRERTT